MNAAFYHSRFGEFVIESEDGDEVLTGNGLPIAPDYVVNWGASFRPTPSVDATVNIKSTSAPSRPTGRTRSRSTRTRWSMRP